MRAWYAWVASRREYWLALLFSGGYYAVLHRSGGGRTGLWLLCAYPLLAAVVASVGPRRLVPCVILGASAVLPPVTMVAVLLLTPRSPMDHPCNFGPAIALAWLLFSAIQVAVMLVFVLLIHVLMQKVRLPRPQRRA